MDQMTPEVSNETVLIMAQLAVGTMACITLFGIFVLMWLDRKRRKDWDE